MLLNDLFGYCFVLSKLSESGLLGFGLLAVLFVRACVCVFYLCWKDAFKQ